MPTPHRLRFVRTQIAVLLGLLVVLAAVDAFSAGLFVLLAVISFVTATELLTPVDVRPRWHDRLEVLVMAALVAAAVAAGARVVELYGVVP